MAATGALHAQTLDCDTTQKVNLLVIVDVGSELVCVNPAAVVSFASKIEAVLQQNGALASSMRAVMAGEGLWLGESSVEFANWIDQACATPTFQAAGAGLYDTLDSFGTFGSGPPPLYVVLTFGGDSGSQASAQDVAQSIKSSNKILVFVDVPGNASELKSLANQVERIHYHSTLTVNYLDQLVMDVAEAVCVNTPPKAVLTASPSPLKLGVDGKSITFKGSSSTDADGDALDYSFVVERPGGSDAKQTMSDKSSFKVTFTEADLAPPGGKATLTVRDPSGDTHKDTLSFTVEGTKPSVAVSSAHVTIDALERIKVKAWNEHTDKPTKDVDGGSVGYRWTVLTAPDGGSWQPSDGDVSKKPALDLGPTKEGDITLVGDERIGEWEFRVDAKDNEGDKDHAKVLVDVRNLPPSFGLTGAAEIDVGDPLILEATNPKDPDGGLLDLDWVVVQAPDTAAEAGMLGESIHSGSAADPDVRMLAFDTMASHAGTWVLELTGTDNEGASRDKTRKVLVDALPVAEVEGPDVSGTLTKLTLDASGSVDPDSPCPGTTKGCHSRLDGTPEVSPGEAACRRPVRASP